MAVPFIDLKAQFAAVEPEVRRSFDGIFRSQQFVLGPHVRRIEEETARLLNVRHAVAVASGSDALYLALVALGVGPGDEVITTPFTFFATAGSITRTGARPVFADVDSRTLNLDPGSVASRLTDRTKAILPVHLFGLCADMDALMELARPRGLGVVEDAAQSIGATYKGRQSGSIGSAGCLSFYPTKNLGGGGDGGMVVTSDDKMAETFRLLRDHGSPRKYYHELVGINSRLDEFQAAILCAKLPHLGEWNRRRAAHAAEYARAFAGLPVDLPHVPEGSTHIYHLYTLRTARRDELAEHLRSRSIGCGVYYPLPLHLQPCYRQLGYGQGDLPVSEEAARTVLSLPMYAEMSADERRQVIDAVRAFFGKE